MAVSTLEDKVEQQKGNVEGSILQDIPWPQYRVIRKDGRDLKPL